MFDSLRELLDKIRLGEDTFLELKEVRFHAGRVAGPSRDSLADELAAFANARGGVCVLGVDDKTRDVIGIPLHHLDVVEDYVRSACQDSVQPPLLPVIERTLLPTELGTEVAVLRVELARSLFVHRSPGGYMHRIGSSKRQMSPDYLARLFQQRSQSRIIRFDEQTVPGATLPDLDEKLWRRFRSANTADEPQVFLRKLGMLGLDEEGVWRPTVAGVLLATNDPRAFLPNAFIQAVAYEGTEIDSSQALNYQRDAADITGPLDEQVTQACRFVARNMLTSARKEAGRTDLPQYDMTAIFEAMVNAVAHRDYAIYGSKIRLRMFADRLELYSPGALANTMTIESLPLRQSVRNEALTSLLARCTVPRDIPTLRSDRATLMDKRGEGVPLIIGRTEVLSGKRPAYELIDGEELVLRIPAANGSPDFG